VDRKKKIRFTILLLTVNIVFITLASIYAHLVARAGGEGIISCQFKHLFKLYCPGCGGSRSLVHLFNFDIISATLAYPPMPVLLFFYLMINLRCALVISSGDIFYLKSFKSWTLIFIPVAILISFVIRNLLLIFYGVDYLGDLTPSFLFL
jgi:hypothetical protein